MPGDMPTPKTTVVNIRQYTLPYVYIGRPSMAGNPFRIGPDGTRDDVMEKYQKYFDDRIRHDFVFRTYIHGLSGQVLGCYCKPLRCHGDIIADYLNRRTLSELDK